MLAEKLPYFWGSFVLYFIIVFIIEVLLTYIILIILITTIKNIMFKIIARKNNSNRLKTIKTLINNIGNYTLWIIMFLFIVYFLGFGGIVMTILAAAGIGTLVFGLASQDLFKDIIGGITILSGERLLIGDSVEIGAFKGVVEDIKLRTVILRADGGEKIILPNGRIFEIKNLSQKGIKSGTSPKI